MRVGTTFCRPPLSLAVRDCTAFRGRAGEPPCASRHHYSGRIPRGGPCASDFPAMSGIGSILALASQAARPLQGARATCVDLPDTSFASALASAEGGRAGAGSAGAASSDYAMALLATITRAGADQALTLIQALSTTIAR